jgi:hypothetical protein
MIWLFVLTAIFALIVPTDGRSQRGGFIIQSTRMVGMGGTGVALPGPDNAVFLNPALLGVADEVSFKLVELQALFNQNTFEQYNFYEDHQDQFEDLDQMTDPERNRFYSQMLEVARDETVFGLNGAAPFSVVGRGYSVGVYERAVVNYDLREGASSIPLIQVDAVTDGEIVLGVGKRVGGFMFGDLCVGANAKYLYRAVTSQVKSAPAVDTFDGLRVYRGWAMAFDFGFLISSGEWAVGGGFYDFNWPEIRWKVNEAPPDGFNTPTGTIEGSMRIGISYRPRFEMPGFLDRFKFALDMESPWSDQMGTFKKLSMGVESRFSGLLMVRAGIHQGYPSAGVEFPFKIIKVEYAFTGEALGRYPGQLTSWNHYVSVGLGWGL